MISIDKYLAGVRKMLALMWSKDAGIRDSVMNAYKELYLTPDPTVHTSPKVQSGAFHLINQLSSKMKFRRAQRPL